MVQNISVGIFLKVNRMRLIFVVYVNSTIDLCGFDYIYQKMSTFVANTYVDMFSAQLNGERFHIIVSNMQRCGDNCHQIYHLLNIYVRLHSEIYV